MIVQQIVAVPAIAAVLAIVETVRVPVIARAQVRAIDLVVVIVLAPGTVPKAVAIAPRQPTVPAAVLLTAVAVAIAAAP